MMEPVYQFNYFNSKFEKNLSLCEDNIPLANLLCALKSSEAKRQYPARLKKFFDYIEIKIDSITDFISQEELNKQSVLFLERTTGNENWAWNSILSFIEYLKTKQDYDEIKLEKEFLDLLFCLEYLFNEGRSDIYYKIYARYFDLFFITH